MLRVMLVVNVKSWFMAKCLNLLTTVTFLLSVYICKFIYQPILSQYINCRYGYSLNYSSLYISPYLYTYYTNYLILGTPKTRLIAITLSFPLPILIASYIDARL
jgi:hypothetical protein